MGKAYTQDERLDIKIRIMEAALDLYHESGAKTLNIRELVKRAGISQGGFYNFWPDKDSLILDVMKYRSKQKLDAIKQSFDDSLNDPVGYLGSLICSWCADMKDKMDKKPIYMESINFLGNDPGGNAARFHVLFSDFTEDLSCYWKNAGIVEEVDIAGIDNLMASVCILLINSNRLDKNHFEIIVSECIYSCLDRFIKVKEK